MISSDLTFSMESLAKHTTLWPIKTLASCTIWAVTLVTVDYTWSMSIIRLIQSLPAVLVRVDAYTMPSVSSTIAVC